MKNFLKILGISLLVITGLAMTTTTDPTKAMSGFLMKGGKLLGIDTKTLSNNPNYAASSKAVKTYVAAYDNTLTYDYVAILNHSGATPPSDSLFKNSTALNYGGDKTYTRTSAGLYQMIDSSAFTADATMIEIHPSVTIVNDSITYVLQAARANAHRITITATSVNNKTRTLSAASDAALSQAKVVVSVVK